MLIPHQRFVSGQASSFKQRIPKSQILSRAIRHHVRFLGPLGKSQAIYITPLPLTSFRGLHHPTTATIASFITAPFRAFSRSFFSASTSPAAMAAAKTKAQSIIDENAVVVFSKSYCPYCRATKSLLNEKKAKYFLMELDEVEDGAALQDALEEITGQRSVPNIFIDHKHIGGNSDLQAKKGDLDGLLKSAGAI